MATFYKLQSDDDEIDIMTPDDLRALEVAQGRFAWKSADRRERYKMWQEEKRRVTKTPSGR